MRRAQLSVFIIIGLFLMIIVGLMIGFSNEKVPKIEKTAPVKSGIDAFIQGCLEETALSGIYMTGLQGGYNIPPLTSFSTTYSDIPYYYYKDDVSLVLSPVEIQQEYRDYILDNLGNCLDFSAFPGYNVTISAADVKIEMGDNNIGINLMLDGKVSHDNKETELNSYKTSVNARIPEMFYIANHIITNTIANPYYIDFPMLFELQETYGMKIDTMTYMDDIVVYVVQDNESVNEGVPFVFAFATMVDAANHAPVLDLPDRLTAKQGNEFYLDIDATDREDDILTYDTDSDFFGINEVTGEITFTPRNDDVGIHYVHFNVTDGIDTTTKQVVFRVQ